MTTSLDMQSKLSRHPDLLEQNIDNDVVLFQPDKGEYYGLQQPSNRIWQLLEQPATCRSIIDQMQQEYEGDPSTIQTDVMEFLDAMLAAGLIQVEAE